MNDFTNSDTDAYYVQAEQKAVHYFKTLSNQVTQKTYANPLIKDFHTWKQNHIHQLPILSILARKKKSYDYSTYIKWLDATGKLDDYLNRSISYLYMRDLGKDLNEPETQNRIRLDVDKLKINLTEATNGKQGELDFFTMAGLYRWAQKENIESTLIWVMDKLNMVANQIPAAMDKEHVTRKIMKIIAGVMMHAMDELDDSVAQKARTNKLDLALRLGYSYGLTYPFIDDLLDANILSNQEETQYTDLIRTTLRTGNVPELGKWSGKNAEFIQFVHSELSEAFKYIKGQQRQETSKKFFEQAYLFFHSQELDRAKDLSNSTYSNQSLYVPIILKSASSRLIARSIISAPHDNGFDNRTFYYGIYNQLADDFTDMFDDLQEDAVTPYTYFLTHHKTRSDLINPFELYWTVIFHLIHNVFHSDKNTRDVILARAINGLKRFKEKVGTRTYKEIMDLFTAGMPTLTPIIQRMVKKADNVDFYDKLLRDEIITKLKDERKEQEAFMDTMQTVRNDINQMLPILVNQQTGLLNEPITTAANYSLEGDGKRLRPIITWLMAVEAYGLDRSSVEPLLRSLEYMHTASLIFDDLPAQDNAPIRRGRPTIHKVNNVAVAELTGLFLTQKAVEEQTSLNEFDPKTVLQLVHYSAQKTTDLCKGQALDLEAKGKQLTLNELLMISHYKTGIALEATLVMPAILAQKSPNEISKLKEFAYHAGIVFQIKDDLLDVEGDDTLLGKPIGKDAANNNATYVSVLGAEGAKIEMWNHYSDAMEVLKELPHATFLKHVLNYILHRNY